MVTNKFTITIMSTFTLNFSLIRTSDNDILPLKNLIAYIESMKGLFYASDSDFDIDQMQVTLQNTYCNLAQDSYLKRIIAIDNCLALIQMKIRALLTEIETSVCTQCVFCCDIVTLNLAFGEKEQELSKGSRYRLICKKQVKLLTNLLTVIINQKIKYTTNNIKKMLQPSDSDKNDTEPWNRIVKRSVVPDILSISILDSGAYAQIPSILQSTFGIEFFKITDFVPYDKIHTTDDFLDDQLITKNDTDAYKLICQIIHTTEGIEPEYIIYSQ